MRRFLVVPIVILLSAGCYHATVDTGLPPSNEQITKSFASSWIAGLIPPSTVETASKCPNGVAQVDTQLSFVNQLVGIITLGIYTPMEIVVTCAARSSASADVDGTVETVLDHTQTMDEQRAVLTEAVLRARDTDRRVLVTVR
jgi:hypothetical protein